MQGSTGPDGTSARVHYYLGHKKRASVFLAYLYFFLSKFKKLYEFCGKNQIIYVVSAFASLYLFLFRIESDFSIENGDRK